MKWLPVMTLTDGTTIEIPMPTREDTDRRGHHGYRVRSAHGVAEFPTLTDVAEHLVELRAANNRGLPPPPSESRQERSLHS